MNRKQRREAARKGHVVPAPANDEWSEWDERTFVVRVDARTFDEWASSLDLGACSVCGAPMTSDGDGEEWFGDAPNVQGYSLHAWCSVGDLDHPMTSHELVTHRWRDD